MIYSLSKDTLNEDSIDNISLNSDKLFVCVITFEQLKSVSDKLMINEKILYECENGRTSKFESYEGFDYISLKIPNTNYVLKPSNRICIIFTKNLLVFICEKDTIIDDIILKTKSGEVKSTSLSKMLYIFFDRLTLKDTYFIENIEQEISELE